MAEQLMRAFSRSMKQRLRISLCAFALFFLFIIPGYSDDSIRKGNWSDLDEGEHEIYGREKEEKVIDALVARKEKWENHYSCSLFFLYNYTDYPKYSSSRLLPFWYSKTSKIDNRDLTWFLLYYSETDGPWRKKVFFPFFRSTSDMSSGSRDSAAAYLFWRGGRRSGERNGSYQILLPLIYHFSQEDRSSDYRKNNLLILPFVYWQSEYRKNETNPYSENLSFSLLHFYYSEIMGSGKGSKKESVERIWGVPAVPLVYYHAKPGYSHFNFLWLIDHIWEDGHLKHSWVAPLWFHSPGPDGYTAVLPPVFFYNRYDSGDYYWHFAPFAAKYRFRKEGSAESSVREDSGLLTLFFSRFTETETVKGSSSVKDDLLWYPIIPVYFSRYDRTGTHRNVLWLFDWKKNADRKLEHLWTPLVLFGQDSRQIELSAAAGGSEAPQKKYDHFESGYFHFLPVYYSAWNSSPRSDVYRSSFVPLWYYSTLGEDIADAARKHEKKIVTPLWYYHSENLSMRDGTESAAEKTFFFPIIPLLYYSHSDNEGTHRNVLVLFDWEKHSDGSMKKLWVPFYYREFKTGGYLYSPLYIRPAGWTEESGYSFGPFHYHSWDRDETVWLNWLHYGRENAKTNERVSSWLWLYYSWENISLFSQPESRGTVMLPFGFNYEDKNRFIHVNILGGAYTSLKTPLIPDISIGGGKKDDRWYVDGDLSWLYDAVGVSWRVMENADTSAEKKVIPETVPRLEKKTSFTRDDSETFFGVHLLFGWSAFEFSESKSHIRVLPLCWLTWDKNSSDRMLINPFFLSYSSDEAEYFMAPIIPLYAHSRDHASTKSAFLINAFWNEWDDETKERELTFLWPFVNVYYSPERSGWRVFPFVWHKRQMENGGSGSWTANPFFYTGSSESAKDGLMRKEWTLTVPLLPLYYHRETSAEFSYQLPRTVQGKAADESAVELNSFTGTNESYKTIGPLFYYRSSDAVRPDDGRTKGEFTYIGLPLLYWNKQYVDRYEPGQTNSVKRETLESTFYCLLYYSHSVFDESSRFLFPLFYSENRGGSSYTNVLGLFSFTSQTGSSSKTLSFLPLFRYKTDDSSTSLLFPLFYASWGKTYSEWYAGLLWKKIDYVSLERSFHVMPLYFSWNAPSESTKLILGTYWHYDPEYERQNIWYILDHRYYSAAKYDSYNIAAGLVSYDISPDVRKMQLAWGMLAGYSSCRRSSDYDISVMWFVYNQHRDGNYFRSALFPAWYYESRDDSGTLIIPPLLTYSDWSSEGTLKLVGLGSLWYSNYGKDFKDGRRMVLAGSLWNEVTKSERGYHSIGQVWGLLWNYETEGDGYSKLSFLKFVYRKITVDGETTHHVLFFSF